MNAEELIARVAAAYASTPIYADTSELVMGEMRGEFRTSFVRATGDLLFEGCVLVDGREVQRYALETRGGRLVRIDPPFEPKSVDDAIAGLTGVTFGAAHTIPRLLWPSAIGGWSILEAPVTLLELTEGRAEIVLTGRVPTRLVIDTHRWLITQHDFDLSERTTITMSYKPSL